jgi:DNA polymerase I-like protein with 3'-5' exonuclease and polymerase domains
MEWNDNTECVAIDTETTGVGRGDYPFAVSLCDDHGNTISYTWEVNTKTRKPEVNRADIRDIKERCRDKELIFHNLSFDVRMLIKVGCKLRWRFKSWDTMIESHVIDSEVHSFRKGKLKLLSQYYLDIDDHDEKDLRKAVSSARRIATKLGWSVAERTGSSKNDHIARDYWLPAQVAKHLGHDEDHPWFTIMEEYMNTDTLRTMMLHLLFQKIRSDWKSDDPRHRILERERKLSAVLFDMQNEGMSIFPKAIESEIKRYEKKTKSAIKQVRSVYGASFNIESPIQLREVLFEKLGFPIIKRTSSGLPSTDKYVRDELSQTTKTKRQRQFLTLWNQYKESITSVKYLKGYHELEQGDYIYPSLIQNGTGTTRMSSQNPNGQNVKKGETKDGVVLKEGLRNVFGPHDGRIWYCLDYSQLQLRIFAYLTEEKSMIEAFDHGYDFHGFIASKIFSKDIDKVTKLERRIGKNVNFGFIFGASPGKIEQTAGVSGLWDTVCKMFPSAHSFMRSVKRQVHNYGYVTTPHGYRLYCDKPHKGVNYIVQGCEGDIVKEGMINCEDYLSDLQANGFNGYMCFQVHDELIFDFPRGESIKHNWEPNGYLDIPSVIENLKRDMEQPGIDIGMKTPVDVEYTITNWGETKKWEST